jgi:RimJ/RimL family protein N-acetyltransferase
MAHLVLDQQERVGAWVAKQVGQGASWGDFYAIGVAAGEDIIAGVVINNYNGANATCHIAIAQQTKAIIPLFQAVCDYAFRHCKLKRLTGMVPTNEPDIIAFDKHLGFEEEFVMKDGAPGADMQVLVMRPETCRWLRKE